MHFEKAKYSKAISLYKKSIAAEAKDTKPSQLFISRLQIAIGFCYKKIGENKNSIHYYKKSLDLSKKITNYKNIGLISHNLGSVYLELGEYDSALGYFKNGLKAYKILDNEPESVATLKENIGYIYKKKANYKKALINYSDALRIRRQLGTPHDIASTLYEVGSLYKQLEQPRSAIDYITKSLEIHQRLGNKIKVQSSLNLLGIIYQESNLIAEALSFKKKALAVARDIKDYHAVAANLNNIGRVYHGWGEFDNAIDYYQQALTLIKEKLSDHELEILIHNNIGLVYSAWGDYDKAINHINLALKSNLKFKANNDITLYNNLGDTYGRQERYDKAVASFKKAMSFLKEKNKLVNKHEKEALIHANIGSVYIHMGDFSAAQTRFEKALDISKRIGREDRVAYALSQLGSLMAHIQKHNRAISYNKQAVKILKKLNMNVELSQSYTLLGLSHFVLGEFENAIKYYLMSINLIEKIRITAVGNARIEYLEKQLTSYYGLISAYMRNNDIENAYKTIELSSSRLLSERLNLNTPNIIIPKLDEVGWSLNKKEALLIYANTEWTDMVQLVITNKEASGREVSKDEFISEVIKRFNITSKKTDKASEFQLVVNYYHSLISQSEVNKNRALKKLNFKKIKSNKKQIEIIGKLLYQLLVEPIEADLEGKDTITIMTDGILGFIPFETLIDSQGLYLVEKYNIKYINSMTVSKSLEKRKYSARKPLLAFGGAVYDNKKYDVDMKEYRIAASNVKSYTHTDRNRGTSSENGYEKLNISNWENLPGTLGEVLDIKNIIPNSEVVTGEAVSEKNIKNLSDLGKLSQYEVLHFATHGLVLTDQPDLSALVLSQYQNSKTNEDGYLQMSEISKLNIKADFVNLSACETGLGRIYGGEGVVGLTQSFLIAGANSVLVSLWKVGDSSTKEFMTSMYKKYKDKKHDLGKTITDIKRGFINGDYGEEYKKPYYWAPFVYYGI